MWLLLMAAVAIALAACSGGGGDAAPTATTASGTPATLAAISAPAATIATAVLDGDVAALMDVAIMVDVPCAAEGTRGNPSPPVCREGDPPGTVHSAFPSARCEGFWATDLEEQLVAAVDWAGAVYALAEFTDPPPADWPADWTRGDQVLIFAPRDGLPMTNAVAVYLLDGQFVRMQLGCRAVEGFITFENMPATVIWRATDSP